jgi:hypothetical protein
MERILVAFCFVFILEAIATIGTFVLFFLFMGAKWSIRKFSVGRKRGIYFSSSCESNFLGFFGQHSHMKTPCIFGAVLCFEWPKLSDNFREVMMGLVSDSVR